MIWTTTPQSFIALGFLKLGHFIRFGSYGKSQDLITFCRPGSSLKILAQFHYQKYFLKIQFKYDQILHDLDYHPIEFHSCRIFCMRLEIIWKLGHVIRFVSYSQSKDLADPVQGLRSSLNFIIRNIFFKSNLNTTKFYMIWTTTPQSFIALGFLKLGHFIRFGSYGKSQDLITFCRPGSSLKILAQFHYKKHFFKIQF